MSSDNNQDMTGPMGIVFVGIVMIVVIAKALEEAFLRAEKMFSAFGSMAMSFMDMVLKISAIVGLICAAIGAVYLIYRYIKVVKSATEVLKKYEYIESCVGIHKSDVNNDLKHINLWQHEFKNKFSTLANRQIEFQEFHNQITIDLKKIKEQLNAPKPSVITLDAKNKEPDNSQSIDPQNMQVESKNENMQNQIIQVTTTNPF